MRHIVIVLALILFSFGMLYTCITPKFKAGDCILSDSIEDWQVQTFQDRIAKVGHTHYLVETYQLNDHKVFMTETYKINSTLDYWGIDNHFQKVGCK